MVRPRHAANAEEMSAIVLQRRIPGARVRFSLESITGKDDVAEELNDEQWNIFPSIMLQIPQGRLQCGRGAWTRSLFESIGK